MSGKLSAKYKFDLTPNFNYLIAKKEMPSEEDESDDYEEDIEI
jgi:hypothetical protein